MKRLCWILIVAALDLEATRVLAGPLHDRINEGLPRYDPAIREGAIERENTIATEQQSAAPPTSAPKQSKLTAVNTKPVVLPEVVVTTEKPKEERLKALPRVETRPAPGKARLEPFLTPEERDARLEEKHLSALDRKVLNRVTLPLFGVSKAKRVRQAEAIERSAHSLNAVAGQIEQAQAAGTDPEYIRNLQTIYYQMYLTRPK